ncbi:transporter [Hymenobacter saemangeumensis]
MTTLLALTTLVGSAGTTLAQNTPEENNPNVDAPFVRNIRADRPGQTVTSQVLRPGRFQLETGTQRQSGNQGAALGSSTALLRIGFFNGMELRVAQPYLNQRTVVDAEGKQQVVGGWAPAVAGAKFMLSPNYDTPTQVAILVETEVPQTGSTDLKATKFTPAGRLLVSQQLGERFGLEGNFGFSQRGITVADMEKGQYLGSLALNGPLGDKAGFFVEAYGSGRAALSTGTTAGLYYRPAAPVRLDVTAGKVLGGPAAGSTTVGAGLTLKLGK